MPWNTVTIGDYVVKTELRDPTKRPRDRFLYVDVSSVDNQAYAIRQPTELLGADAPSRARKVIRGRDVLFATVRPTLRRIALVESALDNQICSTGFCVLRVGPKLDAGFLYYWLLSDDVMEHVAKTEKGVGYPAVRDSDVKAIRMPYPPLDEQRRIAAVLSAVQRAIARQERLIALTAELKKTLMHKVFTEGTRGEPLKQTDKGMLPRNWSVRRFDDVFDCFDGNRVPVKQSDRISGPYPYYGASGIVDYVNDFRFDGEYLLIAEDGENLESRKLPIAFIASGKFWVNNHAHVVKNRVGNLHFFAHFIFQMAIRDYLSGTTRPKLNKAQMMNILLPFPPKDEQVEIANLLTTADRKADLHGRTHGALNSLFRTLLHQLMTAETRVHDLDLSALEEAEQESVGAV